VTIENWAFPTTPAPLGEGDIIASSRQQFVATPSGGNVGCPRWGQQAAPWLFIEDGCTFVP
jgi:hypothetical protein